MVFNIILHLCDTRVTRQLIHCTLENEDGEKDLNASLTQLNYLY